MNSKLTNIWENSIVLHCLYVWRILWELVCGWKVQIKYFVKGQDLSDSGKKTQLVVDAVFQVGCIGKKSPFQHAF